MENDKLINRVKKMMALANDPGASDGERDNALRMSYAIMAKYNLEMSDVEGKPVGPQEARKQAKGEFYGRPWAVTLSAAVARLFFCKYYYTTLGKNQARHTFTGLESNSTTAEEVARVLVESVKKESNRQMRARGENATWRRSFATGAALKISDWVRELMSGTGAGKGMATGTALVLVDLRKREETANALYLVEWWKLASPCVKAAAVPLGSTATPTVRAEPSGPPSTCQHPRKFLEPLQFNLNGSIKISLLFPHHQPNWRI